MRTFDGLGNSVASFVLTVTLVSSSDTDNQWPFNILDFLCYILT